MNIETFDKRTSKDTSSLDQRLEIKHLEVQAAIRVAGGSSAYLEQLRQELSA